MCTRRRNGEGTKQGRLTQGVEPASSCVAIPNKHISKPSPASSTVSSTGPLYFLVFFFLSLFFFIKSHFLSSQGVKMSTFHPDAPHYLALCLFVYFYFVLNVEKIDVSVLVASAALCWSAHLNTHAQSQRGVVKRCL